MWCLMQNEDLSYFETINSIPNQLPKSCTVIWLICVWQFRSPPLLFFLLIVRGRHYLDREVMVSS